MLTAGNTDCVLQVWSPTTRYQLHGITRASTLRLARGAGLTVREKDFSLTEVRRPLPAYRCMQETLSRGIECP